MKSFGCIFLYAIMILAVTGCAPSDNTITPSQTNTPPPSTLTPTITATQPSPTVTPTSTPTPVDTLEPEIASATLEPLLRDPLNCSEPCFWGIIPGQTDFEEAKLFFSRLGFIPFEGTDDEFGGQFYTISYETKNGEDSSVTLLALSNKVESITITPRIIRQEEGSSREWIAYSPETLIKKFGPPSRVEWALDWGPNFVITMTMYFDSINLIAFYSGYNMIADRPRSPRVCPLTDPFDHVQLWMGENPPHQPSFETVSLEEATSLTIEQFTQLMLGDPQQACFVVNGDVFE